MITETIKTLLGADLAKQVEEASLLLTPVYIHR